MTGADISRRRSSWRGPPRELGLPEARFVRSNLYDLPNGLDGDFDLVYTSRGVLGWMPDIRAWAEVVAHFVAPGGRFFITEIHPVVNVFENEGVAPGRASARLPVLGAPRRRWSSSTGSYADPDATSATRRSTAGTTASARS